MSDSGPDLQGPPAPRRPGCERPLAARVLLITDGMRLPDAPAVLAPNQVQARLSAVLAEVQPGSIAVQFRNRELAAGALHDLAIGLRALTTRYAAPLFINDRLDIALSVGADGVHLPGHGLPVQNARALLGPTRFLFAAAHSLTEARMLVLAGADAITLSPIWPTPSKPPRVSRGTAVTPLGLAHLRQVVDQLGRPYGVPIFALGGIDSLARVGECAAQGAQVACLRALLAGEDGEVAARAVAFVAAAGGRQATSTGE